MACSVCKHCRRPEVPWIGAAIGGMGLGLEEKPDGYWPRFHPDIMAGIMEGMIQPRWEEWQAVSAPALVVYGSRGMFSEKEKRTFLGFRPGTRRVDLPAASHDAHLDGFEPWIAALRTFLGSPQLPH